MKFAEEHVSEKLMTLKRDSESADCRVDAFRAAEAEAPAGTFAA
jgi:hypothetical protein